METLFDVAIVGAGPAGSTAAALLAKAGRSVLLIEREKFPRFHIGESLLPYSLPIFERLGIREKLDATFLIKHGAELATACGERKTRFIFTQGLGLDYTTSYQVDRATFDSILLDHAAQCGARVLEQTLVESVAFEDDGAVLHVQSTVDSTRSTIRALYVLDASGRQTLLGSQLALKESYPQLRKFSIFAHFEGVTRDEGPAGSLTRMVRAHDRWFWMIPLGTSRMSIGMVLDTALFKAHAQTPEEAFKAALASQPVIASRMNEARRVSKIYSTGDYSYRNTSFAGKRWLMAGDAAGFLDPVFSTGVHLALLSGAHSADALDATLTAPHRRARLFAAYSKRLNSAMDIYLRLVNAWYRHECAEVISQPTAFFQVPAAINAVLAGKLSGGFALWWRMQLFYLVVAVQRFYPVVQRLSLRPLPRSAPVPCDRF